MSAQRAESIFYSVIVALVLYAAPLQTTYATPILQVTDGQLTGATGVVIGQQSYDVQLINGSCVSLFNGCDSVSDFTINDWGVAPVFIYQLLVQVIVDTAEGSFRSDPTLIRGCESPISCFVWTPWASDGTLVEVVFSETNGLCCDFPSLEHVMYGQLDIHSAPLGPYAVWTPSSGVTEPTTLLLFVAGGASLLVRQRIAHQSRLYQVQSGESGDGIPNSV